MKANVLHISPNFNFVCGVSRNVFSTLTSDEMKREFNLYFVTNGGDAIQKLDTAKLNYSLLNFKTNQLLHIDLIKNYSWLKKFCSEKKINIIHSHHRYPNLISRWVSKSLELKTIVSAHNFVNRFKSFSYRSDKIIAVSNSVRDHLIGYFKISPDKIEVLYNCVENRIDNEIYAKDKLSGLNILPGHKVILYAGRIVEEKGIGNLIDAFLLLKKEINNMQLILLGEGKHSEKLRLKISGNTSIHLLPSQEDVGEFYKIADIVVLPSQREPLGYTMLDAGLFKVPFVGSNAGGISEFIVDGVNGFLFNPGNTPELTNKLKYVLTHPNEASINAENLQRKVLMECNREKYFNRIIDIYSKLLIKK